MTECNRNKFHFQGHGRREVVAQFGGGVITSDAGGLLLREVVAPPGNQAEIENTNISLQHWESPVYSTKTQPTCYLQAFSGFVNSQLLPSRPLDRTPFSTEAVNSPLISIRITS